MCSVFGLIDFENVLTTKKKNRILNVLATVCECRGTDATGIAYNLNGKLKIYKRPVPARKLHINVPAGVSVIMGHTRMTTQGNEKYNYNNHPFSGSLEHESFALAHNGILWNDKIIRLTENLPKTKIETDSYVAVQLIEKQKSLDFNSLKNLAETVEGSFVFTVLDIENSIWFVKGDNPLSIYYYDGFLIYASTDSILQKVIQKLCLSAPKKIYKPSEGDIVKIDHTGKCSLDNFTVKQQYFGYLNNFYYDDPLYLYDEEAASVLDELISVASSMGVSPDEIQALWDYGCDRDEIEELLYDPSLLHEIATELLYAY